MSSGIGMCQGANELVENCVALGISITAWYAPKVIVPTWSERMNILAYFASCSPMEQHIFSAKPNFYLKAKYLARYYMGTDELP